MSLMPHHSLKLRVRHQHTDAVLHLGYRGSLPTRKLLLKLEDSADTLAGDPYTIEGTLPSAVFSCLRRGVRLTTCTAPSVSVGTVPFLLPCINPGRALPAAVCTASRLDASVQIGFWPGGCT